MITFNLNQTANSEKDKNYVFKHGLIFKAGDYEDKNFDISEDELKSAVKNFSPVEIDVEHLRKSPLDGKLGKLEHIMVGEDGKSLYGTVRMPKWFHDNVYKDQPLKVSTTWSRDSKQIRKLALTSTPRINDAVLMAEFSRTRLDSGEGEREVLKDFLVWFADKYDYTKTNKGQGHLQQLHDLTMGFGAVCDKSNKNEKSYSYFASEKERETIQKVHDLAVKAGAGCDFKREYTAMYSDTGEKSMSYKEKVAEFIKALKDGDEVEVVSGKDETDSLKAKVDKLEAEKKAGFSKAPEEELLTEDEEVKKLRERVLALEHEKIQSEAAAFAAGEVKKTSIPPAVEKDVVSFYVQIANDDSANTAEITFSSEGKEKKGNRLDAFKAIFSALKPSNLTKEEVVNMGAGILNETDFNETDVAKEAQEQAQKFAELRNKKAAGSN